MVFFSRCRAVGRGFRYASSSEDHFSTGFHLKKGEKQQGGSADRTAAASGAAWSSAQSYGEKGEELQMNETQTQPICNTIGRTAALNQFCSVPKWRQSLGSAGQDALPGGAVRRVSSISQQSCTVLPGRSVNCWADLKYSLTQSSSSLPALKQRNSVASKLHSNQMSQPSPP